MAKTAFSDGNPLLGILGTIVNATFLNKIFNHRHDGLDQDGSAPLDYAVDTGAANAYAIALSPALAAHVEGMPLHFKAADANTGASTLAINGMAAKPLINPDGSALTISKIKAGQIVTVVYNGAAYMVVSGTSAVPDVKQLQSITAAVANDALTCTYTPTSLDFRSSPLTSGVINTRLASAPLSLVIPSGATLGTINAQKAQLILIALDNAGVIELAVVNIAGGNNLDEATLISTTAISAAADANNVVYSTVARAGVPFRVVGYIESTQANAGTWATAPSTIQGQGGQALAAMHSVGFGQTFQNVIGARAIGTTYYNTTSRPIIVSTYGLHTSVAIVISLTVNGVALYAGHGPINQGVGGSWLVPPGASYVLGGINTLTGWIELR